VTILYQDLSTHKPTAPNEETALQYASHRRGAAIVGHRSTAADRPPSSAAAGHLYRRREPAAELLTPTQIWRDPSRWSLVVFQSCRDDSYQNVDSRCDWPHLEIVSGSRVVSSH
jgi:hypothetical protein